MPLRRLVQADADCVVCFGDGAYWTPDDLYRRVHAVIDKLQAHPSDAPCILALSDKHDILVACLALMTLGKIAWLPGNLTHDAMAAIAPQGLVIHRGGDFADGLDLDTLQPITAPTAHPQLGFWPADAREIIWLSTSGSTGTPKLIRKTAGQLRLELEQHQEALPLFDKSPVLSLVSAQHIYGLLFGLLRPLVSGVPIVAETPHLPSEILAIARATQAHTLVAVPTQLRVLADPAYAHFKQFKTVFSSSAPLDAKTASAWHKAFHTSVTEIFGSTETGGIAFRQQHHGEAWQAFPHVVLQCGDDHHLRIHTPWLPPDAAPFWRTDDRVELLAKNQFQHLGRGDDIYKIAGKRVSLRLIEDAILACPQVQDAAVMARPDLARGYRLEALVAPGNIDLVALRTYLQAKLDGVMIPRLKAVARLPRTATGKLPHAALCQMLTFAPLPLLDITQQGERVSATLDLPTDSPWFEGHLPQWPVLSAVSMIQGVWVRLALDIWPDFKVAHAIERVRFYHALQPKMAVMITLHRQPDSGHVHCAAHLPHGLLACRGVLRFKGGTDHDV